MNVPRRIWSWVDDRSGISELMGPLLRHPVPATDWRTGWFYVLGSATLVTFIVQVVTGIALSTAYVTSTSQAYDSLQFISHDAPFGHLLRGMHYWGASAMVILIGLHTVRVFLMGSYKFPREVSWLTGTVLLLLTLAMAFTGQLLRWDQTAVWSVVVAAEQAGRAPLVGDWLAHFLLAGDTVGGATLSRFFAFHVFFIPAGLFALVGAHLYLVVRNGISEPPERGRPVDPKTYRAWYHNLLQKRGVPFWPDAAWRDVLFAVGVVMVLAGLAWALGAPDLEKPPDPTNLQAYPRPDWYFLWYFSVLALLPAGAESGVIIFGPLIFGVLMVLLPFFANKGERSPVRRPWAVGVVLLAVLIIGAMGLAGQQAPWSPALQAQPLPPTVVGSTSAPVVHGAQLFNMKGCEYCHTIGGSGGARGPNLTTVGSRLTREQLTTRILNGGQNMPAYGGTLTPQELDDLLAFLQSRTGP
jgi:ubiquinol-cytochrome c reductase cytochrome b subunit